MDAGTGFSSRNGSASREYSASRSSARVVLGRGALAVDGDALVAADVPAHAPAAAVLVAALVARLGDAVVSLAVLPPAGTRALLVELVHAEVLVLDLISLLMSQSCNHVGNGNLAQRRILLATALEQDTSKPCEPFREAVQGLWVFCGCCDVNETEACAAADVHNTRRYIVEAL